MCISRHTGNFLHLKGYEISCYTKGYKADVPISKGTILKLWKLVLFPLIVYVKINNYDIYRQYNCFKWEFAPVVFLNSSLSVLSHSYSRNNRDSDICLTFSEFSLASTTSWQLCLYYMIQWNTCLSLSVSTITNQETITWPILPLKEHRYYNKEITLHNTYVYWIYLLKYFTLYPTSFCWSWLRYSIDNCFIWSSAASCFSSKSLQTFFSLSFWQKWEKNVGKFGTVLIELEKHKSAEQ